MIQNSIMLNSLDVCDIRKSSFRFESFYKIFWMFLGILQFCTCFDYRINEFYSATIGHPYILFAYCVLFLCLAKVSCKFAVALINLSCLSLFTMSLTEGNTLYTVAMPLVVLVMAYISSYFRFTEFDRKIIIALSFVFLVMATWHSFNYDVVGYGQATEALKKELRNPNNWGLWTVSSYMIWNSVDHTETWKEKVLDCILFLSTIVALNNYMCRTAMIVLLFYFFVKSFLLEKMSGKMLFFLVIALVIIGTAIPCLYLELKEFIPQMEIAGKSLYSGRDYIWENMFYCFDQNPIAWFIGLGDDSNLYSGKNIGVHNAFWSLINCFGAIYFMVYMYCFVVIVRGACTQNLDIMGKRLLLAFMCVALVSGFMEITFTNVNYLYFWLLPLALAIDRGKNKN